MNSKEQAITQVSEEHRAKEAADASIKRKHEALRRKIELNFQRHKDDIHRLEEELARLRASAGPNPSSNVPTAGDLEAPKQAKGTKIKLAPG